MNILWSGLDRLVVTFDSWCRISLTHETLHCMRWLDTDSLLYLQDVVCSSRKIMVDCYYINFAPNQTLRLGMPAKKLHFCRFGATVATTGAGVASIVH